MTDRKQIFNIAGVYTAIILGAGFASGQELINFFVQFDIEGFIGLIIAGVIFAMVGICTLYICHNKKISSYSEFVQYLAGNFFGKAIKLIVSVFIFVLFSTMIAAGGATLEQAFQFPFFGGVVIIASICFITLLFDLDGLVHINSILAPIMVIGGMFIGLYTFFAQTVTVFSPVQEFVRQNWLVSAVIYASYNIITAVTVLSSMGNIINNKKTAFWGGILGGIAMTILGLCMSLPLFLDYAEVAHKEIPLLSIMSNELPIFEYMYLIIMLVAIYTTAIGNGFAFFQTVLSNLPFNKTVLKFAMTCVGILASQIGFSNFVKTVYPIFGLFGACHIVLIFIGYFRLKK